MSGQSQQSRNLALVAIALVTAVFVATRLGLGGSGTTNDASVVTSPPTTTSTSTSTSTTTTTAPPTTTTVAPRAPVVVPPGDYQAVCGVLRDPATRYVANQTVPGLRELLRTLDLDALAAASNDWLRPSV